MLLLLFLISSPGLALAATGASVTVSSAEGKAGDTVEITVSISGLSELVGVDGIAGGEFELVYDPSLSSVAEIKAGELLAGDLFVYNENYSENSLFVTWVSANELLSEDGTLCIITFTLKEAGTLAPVIRNLSVSDQFLQLFEVESAIDSENSSTGAGESSVTLRPTEEIDWNLTAPGEGTSAPGNETSGETGNDTGLNEAARKHRKTAVKPPPRKAG